MDNRQTSVHGNVSIPQNVAYYRRLLEKLDMAAHEPEGDLSHCEESIWQIFCPTSMPGKQIYQSFSDEELLDIVIRTMHHQGHRPDFDSIYCIYRNYLRVRFGGQDVIKAKAKSRMKHLKNAENWPVDWQERVSIEPVVEKAKKRKKGISEKEAAMLEVVCTRAKKHGVPLKLDEAEKKMMDRLGGSGQVLKMMGIPPLRGSELRNIKRYWADERGKQGGGGVPAGQREKMI